jgi:hypothetical protein
MLDEHNSAKFLNSIAQRSNQMVFSEVAHVDGLPLDISASPFSSSLATSGMVHEPFSETFCGHR